MVAHELSKSAGRAFKAGFYATGQKLERLAQRFRDHAGLPHDEALAPTADAAPVEAPRP